MDQALIKQQLKPQSARLPMVILTILFTIFEIWKFFQYSDTKIIASVSYMGASSVALLVVYLQIACTSEKKDLGWKDIKAILYCIPDTPHKYEKISTLLHIPP